MQSELKFDSTVGKWVAAQSTKVKPTFILQVSTIGPKLEESLFVRRLPVDIEIGP